MKDVLLLKRRVVFGLLATSLVVLGGCIPGVTSNTSAITPVGDLPSITSSVANYNDIELPADMKNDIKKSMSISTDSFRGGIIHYSGRVEINSLKDFIISSMKKNKWKLVGEVSYQNIILAFTKPNRTCMMNLENNGPLSNTTVTLYVTVDVAATKSLNPFGEPIN
ncbi:MAG: hypothetical protein KJ804_01130 [Proteobacteria bacterium]|nr:hypothetical protein [Pseudomonadota bacterium]MBU1056912.1 hypothetical protein [Pseudomonadota bacterium]